MCDFIYEITKSTAALSAIRQALEDVLAMESTDQQKVLVTQLTTTIQTILTDINALVVGLQNANV